MTFAVAVAAAFAPSAVAAKSAASKETSKLNAMSKVCRLQRSGFRERMMKGRLERNKRRAYNTYIQALATYSSVMTSPPDSSVTARQNSREESRSSQMLLPTIFVLSKSIETSIVSKGLPEVVANDVVAKPATSMAVSVLQSALAYKFNTGVCPVPIVYDRVTSLLVELAVYIQALATYSSVMTSPPDSSVTARQNSREESRSSQMLLPTIFVLSKSIETSIVSKGLPEVVANDVVAKPATSMAVSVLQSALAYKFNTGVCPVPIVYDRVTSLLVELAVKSGAASF